MTSKPLDHLRAQVEILRWVKQKRAELKELEDGARAAVEAELGDTELGTLDGEPAIRWSSSKRTILDQKAIKEFEPEIAANYMTTSVVKRFEVL